MDGPFQPQSRVMVSAWQAEYRLPFHGGRKPSFLLRTERRLRLMA